MGGGTEELKKTNPMRLWLERHLGKVILASVPIVGLALAGWIYNIGSEIAVIREKMKEDEAQWSALLSLTERVRDYEVEVRVNQKLMRLVVEKKVDASVLKGRFAQPEASGAGPPPRGERLEEFKVQQMEQIQQRLERK